ncbi:MAG: holo-ACP synthase [Geodermatophilaceae bacterium]
MTGSAESSRPPGLPRGSSTPPPRPVVGVDIVSVLRMADVVARLGERFASRVFTRTEIESAPPLSGAQARHFAARFAAKEAVFKLLQPTTAAPPWKDVEIGRTAGGSCVVTLHGRAEELARQRGVGDITLSMTHEDAYAVAVAVGMSQDLNRSDQ